MSTQAKLLKDVPVIDIGADTPVLALDSSGAVGKGTLAETVGRCGNIVDFPKAEQGDWWRIANIDFCGVGIICIRELWTQSSPRPVVLGVALDAYPGGNSTNEKGIKVLAGNSNRISKIRYVVDVPNKANSGWLDICIPHTDKYKSRRTQIASYGLGIRPVKLAEAPSVDNAHFVKEFDMTTLQSNSGGVISCTAIGPYLVAYKEKGGPHEHTGNTVDRTAPCEHYGKRHGIARISGRFERLQTDGYLSYVYRMLEQAGWSKHWFCYDLFKMGPGQNLSGSPVSGRYSIPHNERDRRMGSLAQADGYSTDISTRKEVVAA